MFEPFCWYICSFAKMFGGTHLPNEGMFGIQMFITQMFVFHVQVCQMFKTNVCQIF